MQRIPELLDTCVAALLVSDCRGVPDGEQLGRAVDRIGEFLVGLGFPETAKTLDVIHERAKQHRAEKQMTPTMIYGLTDAELSEL